MSQPVENKLLMELDKKLDILINSFDHENKTAVSFRHRIDADMIDVKGKIRTLELESASNSTNKEDFKTIKNSIIRAVIGGMVGIFTIAGTLAMIIIKQG